MSRLIKGETNANLTDEEMKKYNITSDVTPAAIPNYWMTAFKNSGYFVLNEKDEEILKHLKDVRLQLDNKTNFTIFFDFEPNEFFSQTTLSKSYEYDQSSYELIKTKASTITGNGADKNPKVKKTTKKIKSKSF